MKIPGLNLENKVAVVTGSGRGIGRGMARALAAAGALVVVADIDAEMARASSGEIVATGGESIPVKVDVTNEADVRNLVEVVVSQFGRIDILVNNAGIAHRESSVTLSLDDWNRVIGTNLTGTFLCSREVARVMIEQRAGKIINISSILGAGGLPCLAAYAASKGGVVQLTRVLAVELAVYGINVNAIAPAYIRTDMAQNLMNDQARYADILWRTPMNRLGEVEELAGPILFLASEWSNYVTGHILYVDGGYTAW